ncbi:hypothetical protein, unknown function [Leishmania donovani]|uniref:NUP-1 protein n=1 Tax=Leishmania donovani TaxID=5661 RepID=E9BJA2_LEIDO|nr:hypothetical protein, unknown function [Leishmania donovani]CBZ35329.1 hypothetical protein, unknown function [Leishmania donovani]
MWGNNFYKAGTHQQSALCCDGQPATMSGSRTSLPSPSYAAQPARPPPAGVLSADLARPISVRELAQSRVPAVPPPPPATQAPRPSATTAGFAGFGVPTSSAVYAATSGVSTSRPLSTHADAGDLTSLAHRDIDHLSGSELYNYASHLQESSRQYSGYLSAAYAKRDQYRGEVAHLKEELHNRYVEIDALRREQERASDALLKVREDNAQLRQKLAEAEGHARNMQAKMSVLSGADPSIAVHFYQSQLALKDAQLRELQQECERAAAASSQRRSSSTTAAEHGRRSANISGEGAAAPHTSPSRDLPSAEELQDGAEAASAALHTALEELQCLNTSLSHRLEEEHTAHKAALAAHAEASATATADRAELLDTIAQLRQQCADMQSAEDELVAALTQRAPISKKDYASLQASYDDLTAALAKAEAQVAALQEKEQQHHHSAQQAQEELRHSLTTGLEERQSMQARNEQMQSLVNHLERELELAERANQLRQEQLDVAISGNQQLAESLHVAQEQLLSATSELQDLRDTRESLESQLRELRQRIEELEQGEQHQRHRHGGAEAERTLIHTPAASAESEASQQRQESEAELASLRSQRDAVVSDRDDIIGEVRRLPDERRALLISPPAHAEEQLQSRSSAVRAPLDVRADDREWQKQEDIAALEAAHQCIEQMKQTIAALQSERVRVEADLKAEVNTLEAELASQSRALAEAEAAAAAQQAHLEEVMAALRDELVATQAQEKRLRASEEAHRERCAEHQRAVEQLQAHVEELERAARDAASSLPTPPPAHPSTAAESELRAMNAALDSLAYQLEDAQHRVKELSAEHARTVEELARATRAVAELEARAADAEGKREVMHTAAEVTEAELMARVAALTAENAQLREKLSTSRAAVTTFASRQTDGESAAASLEERCAAEARRSEAAEAEASALRETLNGTAAELAEVLQRSEDVQATLERTVARLAEQESLVGVLSAESTRLQDELATAQRSVLLLTSERDALCEEAAGLRGKISAAEDRASDAAAAQQRLQACLEEAEAAVRSKDVELSTALAALDRTASEVCDAEQRLQVYSEAKEQLAAEHARTVEELARATRAVAELEARAADAEGKREVMHTAAEVTEAELMARVAALTAENAQLREKLSTSRAAVTTFASRQTDGESAAASLEERCAAEARRSEAAEAEASALRETLNGTAAELAEVLQRSEDVQATLERTVARLAEQEALVEQLNYDASELNDARAVLTDEVTRLQKALAAAVSDKADVVAQLLATQKELDRAAEAQDAQYRDEERLQDALATTTSAFDVQTTQVRLGMAHVVDMSRAFCRVAEVAVQQSASQTDGASGTGTSVQEILSPWTRALEWVAAMEQRLEALDRGAMPNSFTRTNGGRERRRRRRGRTTESENDDAVETESNSGSYVLGTSPLCRAVSANRAEAAFVRLIDEQAAATNTIADLRRTLADKEVDLTNLRSAMDALASDLMSERDRADNLSAAIDDASEKIASAQAEFEEQLRQRTAVTTAEVVEARRAEARATAAQLRAEEQLAAVEKDLKEQEAVLRKLQDENHRLTREADRLLRTSRLEPSSRACSNVSGSVTPKSLSLSATSAENAAQRFTTAPSTLEAIEQAQILQVSSLQADLMLSRRQARELEGREATLRQACAALEQQVSELRAKAAESEHLREDLATLRADYVELEQRYSELELMATAAGGGTMQELKQLRQQLKVREAELEEVKARMRDLVLSKAAPELQAARRQEALRESLSGITTQLAATQAQYGGGTGGSSKARSRRDSLTAALSNSDLNLSSSRPSPQDVLNSRIEHLQTLVHDREVALEKVQAAQLESRAAMDTLEDQLAAKTAALERAEGLVAEYADTINAFTMAAVARRGNRGAVSTTVPPLSSGMGSPDAEALSASVPTLTPLTPRTRAAVNGQPHAAVAMVSPAPRMPNLDEVADDSDGSGEGKQADSAGPSTDSAPPPVTHRRTSASGSWRGAKSCPAHRPSSSTERSAPSSPSNVPGRKSFAGASVPATTRKRARSSTNS